jgi:hypothetical protein
MRIQITLAVAALTLAACGTATATPENYTPEEIAMKAVVARLKDPESARFGRLTVNSSGVVCGSVNARNSMGGYTGEMAFWYVPATGETYVIDPAQDGWGRAYDARLFRKKGCPSGLESMLPVADDILGTAAG